jgi:hypothetical protein
MNEVAGRRSRRKWIPEDTSAATAAEDSEPAFQKRENFETYNELKGA